MRSFLDSAESLLEAGKDAHFKGHVVSRGGLGHASSAQHDSQNSRTLAHRFLASTARLITCRYRTHPPRSPHPRRVTVARFCPPVPLSIPFPQLSDRHRTRVPCVVRSATTCPSKQRHEPYYSVCQRGTPHRLLAC